MKKSRLWTGVVLAACLLAGCSGGFSPDETGVSLGKDGKVKSVAIEQMDKDYYNEGELKSMIDSSVAEYNGGGEKVKLESFEVKDKKATLSLEFGSAADYAAFNNVTFFAGSVQDAQTAGYDFKADFLAVDKGKTKSKEETGQAALSGDKKVVILEEPMLVEVPGNIIFVSSNVEVTGKKEARMKVSEKKQGEGSSAQTEQAMVTEQSNQEGGIETVSGVTQTESAVSEKAELGYIVYE